MGQCKPERVKVTVGEDKEFKIYLKDEETEQAFDLTDYTSGSIKFKNCDEVIITKSVPIPGANPKLGEVLVTLTPTETDQFDKLMRDMQINITDGSITRKILVKDKLEVLEPLE